MATPEDLEQNRVPFLKYDPGTKELLFGLEQGSSSSHGDVLRDSDGKVHAASDFNLAAIVYQGQTSNGLPWQARAKRFLEKLRREGNPKAATLGAQIAPSNPMALTFLLLHETCEVTLFKKYQIADPLARWFHDGLANYLAHQVIRVVFSEEDYLNSPYSPREEERFRGERANVNLLAWARADFEEFRKQPASTAHYFYASHEIRGLAERHGQDFIPQLLDRLKERRPINTENICFSVQAMTGDDLMKRLRSYCPAPLAVGKEMMDEMTQYVRAKEYEKGAALLETGVAADPRNYVLRNTVGVYLLQAGAEKHLNDFLFHMRVALLLQQSAGKYAELTWEEMPDTAPAFFAVGRLLEISLKPSEARKAYLQALRVDPAHQGSKEQLAQLDAEGK